MSYFNEQWDDFVKEASSDPEQFREMVREWYKKGYFGSEIPWGVVKWAVEDALQTYF